MNYFLITPKIKAELYNRLKEFNLETNLNFNLKQFLKRSFDTNNRGILYNKVSDKPLRIKIWSSNMNILLEECEDRGLKTIVLKENSFERFNSMLKYCNVLNNEWDFELITADVISEDNYDYLKEEESYNEKVDEFNSYNKYWMDYDTITKKKEEKSKREQEKSICEYKNISINFDKEEVSVSIKENKYKFNISSRVRLSANLPTERYDRESSVVGEIVRINQNKMTLVIKLRNNEELNKLYNNKKLKSGYVFLDDSGTMIMLNRQKVALKKLFNRDTANKRLKDFMPNIKNISMYSLQNNEYLLDETFNELNEFQKNAVRGALKCSDIFLIQGPPGTGKTTVICEIVKAIINNNQNVLISSQSHLAVDNVLQKIGDTEKVRAIRIGDEEKIELDCDKYMLDKRVMDVQKKLYFNLINFDNNIIEIDREIEEKEKICKCYDSVNTEMRLVYNLSQNYKIYKESFNSTKNKLHDNLKDINDLENQIIKFNNEIKENEELLETINKVLEDYLGRENLNLDYANIGELNLSQIEFEIIENFDNLLSILQVKVDEYNKIEDERNNYIDNINECRESFNNVQNQIYSLSEQYEQTSSYGVRNAIEQKIEDLKYDLSEIRDNYNEYENKIKRLKLVLESKMSDINECKENAHVYKRDVEYILEKNIHLCSSKRELIEIAKLRTYLVSNVPNKFDWKLLKHLNEFGQWKNINSDISKLKIHTNELQNTLNREEKLLSTIEAKFNEFLSNKNISEILEIKKCSIYDVDDSLIKELEELNSYYSELLHKRDLIDKSKELRLDFQKDLDMYQSSFEDMYLSVSNVICATCSGIASTTNNNFANQEFDYVIIDEAAKCLSSELLIPMIKGKKIILVGDHKQISPIIEKDILLEMEKDLIVSSNEKELYLNESLFGITFEDADDNIKATLNKQYRMNNDISTFISKQFYKNNLKDGENIINIDCGISSLNRGLYWVNSGDIDTTIESMEGTSYYNVSETEIIIKALRWLDNNSIINKEVGIISPYKSQKEYLINSLENEKFNNIILEINTIDAFQGREKDIIIMNLVRNNIKGEFGHVSGDSRVNVALSRAKELCMVIGNKDFILNNKNRARSLFDLFNYAKENNLVLSENIFDI